MGRNPKDQAHGQLNFALANFGYSGEDVPMVPRHIEK